MRTSFTPERGAVHHINIVERTKICAFSAMNTFLCRMKPVSVNNESVTKGVPYAAAYPAHYTISFFEVWQCAFIADIRCQLSDFCIRLSDYCIRFFFTRRSE